MEDDLDSMPTMKQGARMERAPEDEHSLDSMPTMKPGGASPAQGGEAEEAERKAREEAECIERGDGRFAGDTRKVEIAPGVEIEFVWVAPGSFSMGSDDAARPVHSVTLTKGYWLGKYEVTQAEWRSVMGENPSRFKGDSLPVEWVSWTECQEFVGKVNAHLAGLGEKLRVRLPTESEWEFASRGGTKSKGYEYSGSDNIDEVAWYDGNSGDRAHKVGTKAGNELGIHDMSGNVWEWCADCYGGYASDTVTDPRGPGSGGNRVYRGGSCICVARLCRSACRRRSLPGLVYDDLGVRLAASEADIDRELIALKVKMSDRLEGVPTDLPDDPELNPLYAEARSGYVMAEEARKEGLKDLELGFLCKVADRLDAADAVIAARREAERKAREEAARKEREEAERKAREEAERKAREEAECIERGDGRFAGDTRKVEIAPGVEMAFVWVAPGSFRMGSDAYPDEKPHHVTLTKGYWIGKYEVTQAEWRSVMGENPSYFKGDSLPVERISWDDCQEFVGKVNDRLKAKGEELRVRLPTEAEWEFAARGGTRGRGFKYSGSDDIGKVAWYGDNSGDETHDVGTKGANELGIHDMSGNVWEWCEDWNGGYASGAVTDPTGPVSGGRVFRGGSWFNGAWSCRSANRDGCHPGSRIGILGVRLAASAGQ